MADSNSTDSDATFIQTTDTASAQQRRIFRALQQVLSPLGVRFEFSIRDLTQATKFAVDDAQTIFQSPDACWQALEYRLWVRCYSQKTLDPQLLAEPLVQQLRQIDLQNFQDAIVQFSRFTARESTGTQIPDWQLKLDLTPPIVRLRSWARWGDVQAITKLLNFELAPADIQVSTVLKNLTLQIFCTVTSTQAAKFPAKKIVLDTIAPLLIALTPQGIQGATIHGVQFQPDLSGQLEPPVWIHWLDLPALGDPHYSPTPIILAARGDENALQFILERLLNPDLEQCFTNGGVSLSLLFRHQLLHVMSEAVVCPIQSQIATTVIKVLTQLRLPGIRGVRVHGRRAGESISQWTYGVDFDAPQPILPPLASPPKPPEPRFVAAKPKINWGQKIGAYLVKTRIWTPQLVMAKTNQLFYQPRFRWQPSILLFLMGVGLVSMGDLAIELAIEARHLKYTPTEAIQSSFNNPLLEQKLAQYQLRCLQHGVPDVLIVGSSRALRGVDPEVLRRSLIDRGYQNPKVYNFGINGATAQVVDLILTQLLSPQQLPKLVIWADGARAFNSGRSDRTYEAIAMSDRFRQLALISAINTNSLSIFQAQSSLQNTYQAIDNAIDRRLDRVSSAYHHRTIIKSWLQSKIPTADRRQALLSDIAANVDTLDGKEQPREINFDGFLPLELTFDPNTYYQKYNKVTGDSDGDYTNFQLLGNQDRALNRTVELLKRQKIPLVFVNMPLSDIYLDKVRRQYEVVFKQYMQTMMESDRLTFIDLDVMFDRKYDRFSDPSHLNQFGANDVSKYLAQVNEIRW
ncbi:DUF1574 family protein [Chamaesiphon sp. OTE_20_metabat_361]|uniref:DUF1574 family protein n=1 Tax=Chamaesiphon sp. OTE_20_metabat_361 TaxID=2964689 RepID=UPI00286D5E6A|nr:DUF1574 family protein [Chamaesiphon sp. OTE_20_metabat_361]